MRWILLIYFFLTSLYANSLQLTQEEKDFLHEHSSIVVHIEKDYAPFIFVEEQKAKGFAIEYTELIANKLGITLMYETKYNWHEALSALKEQKLDMIVAMVPTEERQAYTTFTPSFLQTHPGFAIKRENIHLKTMQDLVGKKVAVPKGYSLETALKAHYPRVTVIEVNNNLDALEAVSAQKADAALSTYPVLSYLQNKHYMLDLLVKPLMNDRHLLKTEEAFGFRKDYGLMRSAFTKAMQAVSVEEKIALEQKWFGRVHLMPQLTLREKDFLQKKKKILVYNAANWVPLNYTEEGKAKGFAIDVIKKAASKVGLEVGFVQYKTWHEALKLLKNKELDVMADMVQTKEREAFALFTSNYITLMRSIYVHKNFLKGTNSFKKIAIPKGTFYEEYLKKHYPKAQIVQMPDYLSALRLLVEKKVDAVMGVGNIINYLKQRYFMTDILEYSTLHNKNAEVPLSIGVRKDLPELRSILQKGLDSITPQEHEALFDKWSLKVGSIEQEVYINAKESFYLSKKTMIRFCTTRTNQPFEYKTKEGAYTGFSIDLLKQLSRKIGKHFSFIPTESLAQSLEFMKENKCDMLSLATPDTKLLEGLFLSHAYAKVSMVVATKESAFFIENIEQLKEQEVAVKKGYAIAKRLQDIGAHVVYVDHMKEAVKLMKQGVVYGFVDVAANVAHMIKTKGYYDLKINGNLGSNVGWHFVFADESLQSLINKQLSFIGEKRLQEAYSKWLGLSYVKGVDYTILYKIISIIVVIMLFMLYRYVELKKFNKKIQAINEQLQYLTVTDSLTKLFNRMKLEEVLDAEFMKVNKIDESFSVILIDIDHFKQINDTYGHEVGDKVLQEFATLLQSNIRKCDTVGRWGGEEFLIICKGCEVGKAKELATMLRNRIEMQTFAEKNITASFGVAEFAKGDIKNRLVARADEALYSSKHQGRNRVTIFKNSQSA